MTRKSEFLDRYSRQIALRKIGLKGQQRISRTHITVIGLGGLGSVSSLQLAAIGVGCLRLIDQDIVELSNLHRQILYTSRDLNIPKAEVATRHLQEINPDLEVEPITETVGSHNIDQLIKGTDVVIDGLDSFKVRYAVNRACINIGIPYLFGGALETYGNTTTIIPQKTPCLECIFAGVRDQELPTCETVGVLPTILGVIASMQVNEALRIVTGQKPALASNLFLVDLENNFFGTFPLVRKQDCPICGGLEQPKTHPSQEEIIQELCGGTFMFRPKGRVQLNLKKTTQTLASIYQVKHLSQLGILLQVSHQIFINILISGNMLIRGAKDRNQAETVYAQIKKLLKYQ